jgi:WD40 repeat protein
MVVPEARIVRIRGYPTRPDQPTVVHRVQFGPGGRTLAAWLGPARVGATGRPGTYEVCWVDVASGRVSRRTGLLNDFGFAPYPNWDPAVSPDLRVAALLNIDGFTLTLHDTRRGQAGDRDVLFHYEEVSGFCFDPAGRWLFAAGYQGNRAPVFREPAACQVIRCEPARVLGARRPPFIPRQVPHPLIPGTFYTQTRPPPPDPWQIVADIPDRAAEVTAQVVAPDGRSVAAGSDRGTVWVFAIPSGSRLATLRRAPDRGGDRGVYRLTISPGGDQLAVLHRGCVAVRALSRPGATWRSGQPVEEPRDLAFTQDGAAVLVSDLSGSVFELDAASGRVRRAYPLGAGPLYGVTVAPRGRRAAAGAADGRVVLWELEP